LSFGGRLGIVAVKSDTVEFGQSNAREIKDARIGPKHLTNGKLRDE
jgi:hypothetical protein